MGTLPCRPSHGRQVLAFGHHIADIHQQFLQLTGHLRTHIHTVAWRQATGGGDGVLRNRAKHRIIVDQGADEHSVLASLDAARPGLIAAEDHALIDALPEELSWVEAPEFDFGFERMTGESASRRILCPLPAK